MTFTSKSVTTAFGVEGVTEPSNTYRPLTTITLPDSSTYTFTYDSYGLLASMTLPTGATINFTHANTTDAQGNVNRFLNTVVVDSQTTTYTPGTCGTNCNKMVVRQPTMMKQSIRAESCRPPHPARRRPWWISCAST